MPKLAGFSIFSRQTITVDLSSLTRIIIYSPLKVSRIFALVTTVLVLEELGAPREISRGRVTPTERGVYPSIL